MSSLPIRLALAFLLTGFCVKAASPEPMTGEAHRSLTPNGAWCWFSDPRAIAHEGKLYAGWMTSDGSVQVAVHDHLTSQTAIATLAEEFQRDDHDNPALLFLPDGRLAAFYSLHSRGDMHLRITTKPRDIGAWTPDRMLGFQSHGGGRLGVTYANPALLDDEASTIFLFWRGSDFKPAFSLSRDLGETWSAPRTLIKRAEATDTNRPYVKMWTNHRGRIDLIFTDGHPRNEPANRVYFLRYERGAFWKADGSRLAGIDDVPLDPEQCDLVYDGTHGRAWIWDLMEDADGRPVIAYTRLPAENDHHYHRVQWDGMQWRDTEITPGGGWFPQTAANETEREPHYSGGLALDPLDPTSVYVSRPIHGVFEIERWTTDDGGRSWTSHAVTKDSGANNVRPFVARHADRNVPRLLWMNNHGGYVHYTNFHTSIKLAPTHPQN